IRDKLVTGVQTCALPISTLPALFELVARQRVPFPYETIVVDSGSTDGSLDLLRRRADRVVSIAADAFDHGLTRNLGIEHARGEQIGRASCRERGWAAAVG